MIKNRKLTLRSAFIVTAMSKYSRIIINLVFTIILARLLTPEDYGIVAVTNVFINFFAVFSDMGISVGVIQNKELTDEDNNNIYSFSVYFGIVLSVIFALFSFLMARFYQNNIYIPIADERKKVRGACGQSSHFCNTKRYYNRYSGSVWVEILCISSI